MHGLLHGLLHGGCRISAHPYIRTAAAALTSALSDSTCTAGYDAWVAHCALPTPLPGGLTARAVSTGGYVDCALDQGGRAYCWGEGRFGGLGNGTAGLGTKTRVPVAAAGDLRFTTLGVGLSHVCGLATDSRAYCWGNNFRGFLGDGSRSSSAIPVPVRGGLTFRALSVGVTHTCGVTTDAAVYCWGTNLTGELGLPTAQQDSNVPVLVILPP